jgi:tetraspanin-7
MFSSLLSQITGVILLAVGVWGKLTLGTYISLIAENSTNAPYVLIGTGTTIVVFGLFGCFATCRGSPWMLKLVSTTQHDVMCFLGYFYKTINSCSS